MTIAAARTYRSDPSRPIPVWNGILEHLPSMGMSVWLYLWCLDRITYEQDGVGYVLGGMPVKVERIAGELSRCDRAIRYDLTRLKDRYLSLRRTPYGYVIHVLNSQKFGIWRRWERSAGNRKSPVNFTDHFDKSCRSKEDPAVDPAEKQQPAAALEPWEAIGLSRAVGDAAFRQFWETTWASRNGHPLSRVMGDCADFWQKAGGTVPGPFFRGLARIRQLEKVNPVAQDEIPLAEPYR